MSKLLLIAAAILSTPALAQADYVCTITRNINGGNVACDGCRMENVRGRLYMDGQPTNYVALFGPSLDGGATTAVRLWPYAKDGHYGSFGFVALGRCSIGH